MKQANRIGRAPERRHPMGSEDFRLFWPGISLKARESFREVTNEDIQVIDGEKTLFVGIVRSRCGWAREQIEEWLEASEREIRIARNLSNNLPRAAYARGA